MVYNAKIKVLRGNDITKIIIKEYSSYIDNEKEDIDVNDLKRTINDSGLDDLYKVIIEEKDKNKIEDKSKDNIDNDKKARIRKDNIIRARNEVFDLAFVNDKKFNSFLTLTFKENITDVDKAYDKFNIWTKQIRRYCKKNNHDLSYLGVIEFQKRGAIHYHLFTSLECGSDMLPLQKGKTNQYDVEYWRHGFSSAFDIRKNTDDNFNIALYICKYMTKKNDDSRLKDHRRYYHSRNLDKPITKKFVQWSVEYQTIVSYINSNDKISITNEYHHIPKEYGQKEFMQYEFKCNNDDELNIIDIINADLEF